MFAMTDDDWRIRAAAVTAVGRARRHGAALPALHRALEDPDTYVQQSAVLALDKIAGPLLVPAPVQGAREHSDPRRGLRRLRAAQAICSAICWKRRGGRPTAGARW